VSSVALLNYRPGDGDASVRLNEYQRFTAFDEACFAYHALNASSCG